MAVPFPYVAPVAHAMNRGSVTLRDGKGFTRTWHYYLNTNGDTAANGVTLAQSLASTWAAMSNAAVQSTQGYSSEYGVIQRGANSEYQSVQQKAILVMQDNAGTLHRFSLPAPKIAIFLADGVTVDKTNTLVQNWVAAMGATGSPPAASTIFSANRDGGWFATFVGGTFQGKGVPHRVNITILDATLTNPEE